MRKYSYIYMPVLILAFIFFIDTYIVQEKNVITNLNVKNIRDITPKVALTFDDGPSSIYTKKLLDGLKERNVKATFFVLGSSVEENKDIVRRMSEEGHLIGNHTYSHIDIARTNYEKSREEIIKTSLLIEEATGRKPVYIRPPFGDITERLLEETKMGVVLWNVDPEDWKYQNRKKVVKRVIDNVKPGDIILLHDIFKTSVDAALDIVDILKERGYRFVTVDKMKNEKIYIRNDTMLENKLPDK